MTWISWMTWGVSKLKFVSNFTATYDLSLMHAKQCHKLSGLILDKFDSFIV